MIMDYNVMVSSKADVNITWESPDFIDVRGTPDLTQIKEMSQSPDAIVVHEDCLSNDELGLLALLCKPGTSFSSWDAATIYNTIDLCDEQLVLLGHSSKRVMFRPSTPEKLMQVFITLICKRGGFEQIAGVIRSWRGVPSLLETISRGVGHLELGGCYGKS